MPPTMPMRQWVTNPPSGCGSSIRRGANAKKDVLVDFDWWPHIGRDLADVRRDLAIPTDLPIHLPPPPAQTPDSD